MSAPRDPALSSHVARACPAAPTASLAERQVHRAVRFVGALALRYPH